MKKNITIILIIAIALTGCNTIQDILYDQKNVDTVVDRINPETGETEKVTVTKTQYVPSQLATTTTEVLNTIPGLGTVTGTALTTVLGIGGLFLNQSRRKYAKAFVGTVSGVDKILKELEEQDIAKHKITHFKNILQTQQNKLDSVAFVAQELAKLRSKK